SAKATREASRPPPTVSRAAKLLPRLIVDFGGLRQQKLLQISHLVKRPDFDLARSRQGIGAAPHPGDRLVHVLDFPEPEACDQFAGLGERPVDDGAPGTIERNTLALRGGLESVA